MTVDVDYDDDYRNPASEVQAQDRIAGWRPRLVGDPADTYAFLAGLCGGGRHGERFKYCSAGTDVPAWIVESVTGLRHPDPVSRRLWSKLGCEHDAQITVDAGGWVRERGYLLHRAGPHPCWPPHARCRRHRRHAGGFGRSERADYYAAGIHGQFIWVDPGTRTVIVKFSSWPEPVTEQWNRVHARLFRDLCDAFR